MSPPPKGRFESYESLARDIAQTGYRRGRSLRTRISRDFIVGAMGGYNFKRDIIFYYAGNNELAKVLVLIQFFSLTSVLPEWEK